MRAQFEVPGRPFLRERLPIGPPYRALLVVQKALGTDLEMKFLYVLDATHTFDRRGPDGTVITADDLARVTAANLQDEFATVTTTAAMLRW